jgi:hypothetical protein
MKFEFKLSKRVSSYKNTKFQLGVGTATASWRRANLMLSYAKQVWMMLVTDETMPNAIVKTKITIAIQKVYHCNGFRRSAHIWLQPIGGEWKMQCSSKSRSLQWWKSEGLRGRDRLVEPSIELCRWNVWSCWSMKLSVSGSQCGNSSSRDSRVSCKTETGIIDLLSMLPLFG